MASGVLVWVEQRQGIVDPISLEALGVALQVAPDLGGRVDALVIGDGVEEVAQEISSHGANRIIAVNDPTLRDFRLEPFSEAVMEVIDRVKPELVLMGASNAGLELSAHTSARLGCGLASDCTDLVVDKGELVAVRPILVGNATVNVRFGYSMPPFVTLRRHCFDPAEQVSEGDVEILSVSVRMVEEDISTQVLGFDSTDEGVSLADAGIVVSGGRGVGGPEGFVPVSELAKVLGGALGASRAAVDSGWISYEHQVGQTGKTVQPDLYIACGISGAVQHLSGMRSSRVIVAINKNGDAPIFEWATYGIVGDLFDYVPALTNAIRKHKEG